MPRPRNPKIARDCDRRLCQGVSQGYAHERRGARRGHDRGQDAAQEGSAESAPRIHPPAEPDQRRADLEDAEETQAEHEDNDRQDDDEGRRLELESPAQLLSPGPQGDQDGRQREKGDQDARGEDHAVAAGLCRVVARLVDEPEHLDGQHGEDAGHQVEDQAADEGEEQGLPQAGHEIAGYGRGRKAGDRRTVARTRRSDYGDRRRKFVRVDGAHGQGALRSGAAPSIGRYQYARDLFRPARVEARPAHR